MFSRYIFLLLFSFISSISWGCGEFFTLKNHKLLGNDVEYYNVDDFSVLQARMVENAHQAIYVGITRKGHAYLWANGTRFDGGLLSATKVRDLGVSRTGLLIELKGESLIHKLNDPVQLFSEYASSYNCVQGACSVLQGEGLLNLERIYTPAHLLSTLYSDKHLGDDLEITTFLHDGNISELSSLIGKIRVGNAKNITDFLSAQIGTMINSFLLGTGAVIVGGFGAGFVYYAIDSIFKAI